MYVVYHDTDVMSKEYFCERVEEHEDRVVLYNVCGDTIAQKLYLSIHRGDVRVLPRFVLKVA
jgi:hypothetical protein